MSWPEFKTDKISLLNCDCMDYMATVPDKHFDLAIVDPPYGINVNMNMGKKKGEKARYEKKKWDKSIPDDGYFTELQRISKNQVVFGGNYFAHLLPPSMGWICWDKAVPDGVSFSDFELAWTSFNQAAHKAVIAYCGFIGLEGKRIHPTEKPIPLYKWVLKNYAKEGNKILDTHGGSMSIARACYDYGFELTLCEKDKDYFTGGVERFKKHISQQTLFKPQLL